MRLLIVEDHVPTAEMLACGLSDRGYACDCVVSLAALDTALASAHFDLVLLDLGLPDGDGLDWLRLRKRDRLPPILVLTARGQVQERVIGLDAGADDYLPKPFDMSELEARIRAVLRRPGTRGEPVIVVGDLRYDTINHSAHIGSERLELSRREANLLELLMRRAGQVVRRSQIEEGIYTFHDSVTPNAIEAIVSRLRRKLEDAGWASRLQTIRGVGYLLGDD